MKHTSNLLCGCVRAGAVQLKAMMTSDSGMCCQAYDSCDQMEGSVKDRGHMAEDATTCAYLDVVVDILVQVLLVCAMCRENFDCDHHKNGRHRVSQSLQQVLLIPSQQILQRRPCMSQGKFVCMP